MRASPVTLGWAVLLGATLHVPLRASAPDPSPALPAPAPNSTALEALQRLKGLDLDANPALKAAVMRIVDTTRGTIQFVELVRDFNLEGQEAGLLEVAAKFPRDSAGTEAVRLLLKRERGGSLREALANPDTAPEKRLAFAQALANSADPAAVPLLADLLKEPRGSVPLRACAVHGLARTEPGAARLLNLGRDGVLDEAARNTAALELAQCRWPAIRQDAALLFPLPRAADGSELPPIAELVQLRGDAAKGAQVFRSEQAGCIKCHRIGNEGMDFGPALSEIGTKLARQALYESILDPSAGISFGYEGWTVETRDGDELFGILASETPEELAIKLQTGVTAKIRKADVAHREKQALSIMPAGLAQILTRQQLIDVVEYLTTLKAK